MGCVTWRVPPGKAHTDDHSSVEAAMGQGIGVWTCGRTWMPMKSERLQNFRSTLHDDSGDNVRGARGGT